MVGNYGEIIKEALAINNMTAKTTSKKAPFIPADNQQPAAGKDIHTLR